jgi:tetratricopeptide (TPR) repeat protein
LNFVLALLLLLAQPSDALLFARARAYTENGQFQQAIELWQEMTERHPDRVDAWAYLALAFRRQESFDLADRAVDHALEVDRESSRALWQRGLLRNLQQRPAEALDAFDLLQVKAAKQATFHYQRRRRRCAPPSIATQNSSPRNTRSTCCCGAMTPRRRALNSSR